MKARRALGPLAVAAAMLAATAPTTTVANGLGGDRSFDRAAELADRDRARAEKRAQRLAAREAMQGVADERRLPGRDSGGTAPTVLSCGMPCDTGTLTLDHVFYDILVDCVTGEFGIRTGASHPATIAGGGKQDILFDAAVGGVPAGGRAAIYVHEEATLFDQPSGHQACIFDPPDTMDEPNSMGIEVEWSFSPRAGLTLQMRHELVTFGSGPEDAGVRLTLSGINASVAESTTLGLRWWLDPAIAQDDGPSVSTVDCQPFNQLAVWTEEYEFPAAEITEQLLLTNDDIFGAEPVIEFLVSTSALSAFPNTGTPDRLVAARWANAPSVPVPPWDYMPVPGDPTSDDVILMSYTGYDVANGIALGPAQTFERSLIVSSSCDRSSSGCVPPVFTTSVDRTPVCPGDRVTLSGTVTSPGLGSYVYVWTFGDGSTPVQVTDPTVPVDHVYTSPDFYRPRLTASESGDPGCSSFSQVDVAVELGQVPTGQLTDELRVTRTGPDVELSWPGSPVMPPSFVAFRADGLPAAIDANGVLDDTLVSWTMMDAATDMRAVGAGPLFLYRVFPADLGCGHPITPPNQAGFTQLYFDDFEVDNGWVVDPELTDMATTGIWVREDPNGTSFQVEDDVTDPGVNAWVTGNQPGAGDGDDDVDGGCTTLQSPIYDVRGRSNVRVSYWRAWAIGAAMDDTFVVQISNNGGGSWTDLETITASTGGFQQAVFDVDAIIGQPLDRIVLRFIACDNGMGSFLEAAVDDVWIGERF